MPSIVHDPGSPLDGHGLLMIVARDIWICQATDDRDRMLAPLGALIRNSSAPEGDCQPGRDVIQ
jgi:hypothetical protein